MMDLGLTKLRMSSPDSMKRLISGKAGCSAQIESTSEVTKHVQLDKKSILEERLADSVERSC